MVHYCIVFLRVCVMMLPKSTTCICHRVAAVYYWEWTTLEPGGLWPACHIQLLSELWWLISPTRGQYWCESKHNNRFYSPNRLFLALKLLLLFFCFSVVLYVKKNVNEVGVKICGLTRKVLDIMHIHCEKANFCRGERAVYLHISVQTLVALFSRILLFLYRYKWMNYAI